MNKGILAAVCMATILCFCSPAIGMEVTDTLNKNFKSINYPNEEKSVTIRIKTVIEYLKGNKQEHDELQAIRIQQKVVSVFKQNGWHNDDQLLTENIDGGLIEIVPDEGMDMSLKKTNRLSIFLHMCDQPKKKYRGGDLNEYLNQIIEDTEYCLTYDNRLQGKNYPY